MSFGLVAAGIAAVAAAAISYENSTQTADKADQVEAQNITQQSALQKKADQATQNLLNQDSQSNDTSAKSSLLSTYNKALAANSAQADSGLNQVGNTSSAYKNSAAQAAAGISTFGNTQANDLASMDAPGVQRQTENAGLSALGSTVNGLQQQSQGDNAVSQVKLSGVRANPWLTALSTGLNAYATSGASSAWGSPSGGIVGSTGDGSGPTTSMGGYTYNLPNTGNG